MSKFRAPRAARVIAACLLASVPAAHAQVLQLSDAFARVIDTHPDLAVLRHVEQGLAAERERAALSPPLTLGAMAENALGTGDYAGVKSLELTLSLGSVLERGGKRAARTALAERQYDALESLRAGKRLDLLAEVVRRYLAATSAQALEAVARTDLAQRRRTVTAASQRVAAGGAPASVRLAAEAAQARAEGDVARAQRAQLIARRRLALLWGDGATDFELVAGDLMRLPAVADLSALLARLADAPEIQRFAHEERVREARVQLARSARAADVTWEVGVRRLHADDDFALVGGVTIPFGSAARAAAEIRAAEAQLAALELEREGQMRGLQATLAEAWGQLDAAAAEARHVEHELLPRLVRAEQAAEHAYRAGAASYLEWAQLQGETTAARRQQLEAALAAHRALIELQRLTGESFLPAGERPEDSVP